MAGERWQGMSAPRRGHNVRREASLTDHACQTDMEADDWLHYVARLPPLPPNLALSLSSLTDSIVRIYVRAAATIEVRGITWHVR